MTAGLVFYPKSHRYRLDGQWVPGVTGLIGKGLPKPALPYWAAKMVAEWVADNPDLTEDLKRMGGRGPAVAFLKPRRDIAEQDANRLFVANQLQHPPPGGSGPGRRRADHPRRAGGGHHPRTRGRHLCRLFPCRSDGGCVHAGKAY